MYLHIGKDFLLRRRDIVAILDIDNCTGSVRTREFLSAAEKAGEIINAAEDIPRSFILSANTEGRTVYLSQLSPATLARR